MDLFQSTVLSLIQGITEFLPISSTGHLHLAQRFFGLSTSLSFDIFLNTASLLTVLFFFRQKTAYFFKNLGQIIVGTIPAVVVGLLFKDQVEALFSSTATLPYEFLLTSFLLISTHFLPRRQGSITYLQAFIIGLFQALAIIPAISRSGSTIFAALLLGLSPLEAFNFSFSLFIPASLGALLLDFKELLTLNPFTPINLFAFILTFLTGIMALSLLQRTLVSRKFWLFGLYTLFLGLALLTLRF